MPTQVQNDRLLIHIIEYGFSLGFGLVLASLQALRPAPTGFVIEWSWWSLVALLLGAGLTLPCFQIIVRSERKWPRRTALAIVTLLGVGAFFYPMRVVPREKLGAIFVGLAVAASALAVMGGLLLLLYRFFEKDEKGSRS